MPGTRPQRFGLRRLARHLLTGHLLTGRGAHPPSWRHPARHLAGRWLRRAGQRRAAGARPGRTGRVTRVRLWRRELRGAGGRVLTGCRVALGRVALGRVGVAGCRRMLPPG
ncbi:MAG: hypothetical protein LBI49_06860, partial [Nocardiopsaceae bacterium]|nr:hypothetical protein [Nocardiopsaceae bacterium]